MTWRPLDLTADPMRRHDIFLSHAIVDSDAIAAAHARISAEK
jgi:hypothetical protein